MRRRIQRGAVATGLALVMALEASDAWARHSLASTVSQRAAKPPAGSRRGRPRKFNGPTRSVALTLPEDVIQALQMLDRDLSRAVVRAAQPLLTGDPPHATELASFGGRSIILVPSSRALVERTGAQLIPLPGGRALISLDDQLTVSEFELRVSDALADPAIEAADRALFEELADILRQARRAGGVSLRQPRIIVLQRARVNNNPVGEAAAAEAAEDGDERLPA